MVLRRDPPPKTIEAFFPFIFTGTIDPRAVLTVGDQVVCEHVFAFHARESIKSGFEPVISRVEFPSGRREISIAPRYRMALSDGSPLSLDTICAGIRASLEGTQHAPYASLVDAVECDASKGNASIKLKAVPVNMRGLFTIPDFSIFDPRSLPLTGSELGPTTGPYSIGAMTRDRVDLVRNPHYPAALTANTIDSAILHSYAASRTSELIDSLDPHRQHMVYLYGYAMTRQNLAALKAKDYIVETFPDEWLIFVGFGRAVSSSDRKIVGAFVDGQREGWLRAAPLGTAAYSIPPADRPFGVTMEEYRKIAGANVRVGPLSTARRLITHKSWYSLPLFKAICDSLLGRFPQLHLELVDDFGRLYADDRSVFISPLGISHSDPLPHLSFLSNVLPGFRRVVSGTEIAKTSVLTDPARFDGAIRSFERKILDGRILVPVGHFPGVVAHAPRFERDEDLSFSWGIQTWTYRIR